MEEEKKNLIVELTFQFSLDIIVYTELLESKRKFNLANQLFRSETAIGANVRESQHAESKKDFIHKLKIAGKEAEESEYWLLLCKHSKSYPDCDHLLLQIRSILKVIGKIISSSSKD